MVRFSTGTIIIAEIAAFHNSRQTAMFPSHHQKSDSFRSWLMAAMQCPAGDSTRLDEQRPKNKNMTLVPHGLT